MLTHDKRDVAICSEIVLCAVRRGNEIMIMIILIIMIIIMIILVIMIIIISIEGGQRP